MHGLKQFQIFRPLNGQPTILTNSSMGEPENQSDVYRILFW